MSYGMIYVVGSGPAGVSCASALLRKGMDVTLLDAGLELEPERSGQVARLQNLDPESWRSSDLAFLKEGTSADIQGIPLKYAYGSDFPYRDPGVDWRLATDGVETRPSYARGGLSTVWGAAIMPYRADDIHDWPVTEHELARHYQAVLDFMPLAGCRDSLEQFFPLHSQRPRALKLSSQASEFLNDLGASADKLKDQDILYGASRLAMWSEPNHHRFGCQYCGQCMYGCPYGLIYSSSHTLDALCEHPNFTYRKNVVVDRLVENADTVTLMAHDVSSREQLQLHGSRVFLACGLLATTKILLESLEAFEQVLTLQDSCYFLLPLLRFRATPGVSRERLHTLAQVFLEIMDPQVCEHTVHLQVYAYNDLYSVALKKLFGPAFGLLQHPATMLLDRLLLIQGYLPSSYSSSIRTVLRKDPTSGLGTLHLSPVKNDRTAPALKNLVRKLARNYKYLQAIPIGPMLRPGKPGRSFHSGGAFPMKASPGPFQSDRYGRPYGFKRVHAVDSTIFPSIPATTITLSVMANAHRIGSGIGEY
jgi:choline dehydrogenase-like flavoprotein